MKLNDILKMEIDFMLSEMHPSGDEEKRNEMKEKIAIHIEKFCEDKAYGTAKARLIRHLNSNDAYWYLFGLTS